MYILNLLDKSNRILTYCDAGRSCFSYELWFTESKILDRTMFILIDKKKTCFDQDHLDVVSANNCKPLQIIITLLYLGRYISQFRLTVSQSKGTANEFS